MLKDFLKQHITSQAKYVEYGYGQVEPNHLSAQRTSQVYAQLPAAPSIKVLEQGQFVKYDYAANENGIGEVNFTGAGEWMLVYNEIKLYREHQLDCEFALRADDYQARIYSPYDYENVEKEYKTKWLNGVDAEGNDSITLAQADGTTKTYKFDDVTADTPDYWEMDWTNDPFTKLGVYKEKRMPAGTSMVPRVLKTNVGDLFTTNTINETELVVGDLLAPGKADGILCKSGDLDAMKWQVVKVYTMPDGQKGVKVMRIA